MTPPAVRTRDREGLVHAGLAAALLAATAFVRVPTQLYAASRQDFSEASIEVLVLLLGAGLVLFLGLTFVVAVLPARGRGLAGAAMVALATYAWVRASFFPGPSLNLDGRRLTADLSTGVAGLLVPLAVAVLLAGLGRRQPRIVTTLLAVLLGGALVQSALAAASTWRAAPRATATAAESFLEWSREGNVLVMILDTLQADVFEDALEAEPRLRQDLDGFRFYRAASSPSPTTYLSLPAIHSGRRYDPGRSAREFFVESIREDSVLNQLAEAGYRTSYAMSLRPCPKAVEDCQNISVLGRSRRRVAVREALHLLDLGMYRVMPDRLRPVILAGGRGLLAAAGGRAFLVGRAEGQLNALRRLASSSSVTDSPPTAKMLHTGLTHPPLVLRPDCATAERSYERSGAVAQIRCAFRPIVALFEWLKAEGLYDSSDIVLLADHGYGFPSAAAVRTRDGKFRQMVGAFNATVLAKPAGERGPLTISDAPIELADLPGALCAPADCSPSEGLRRLADVDPGRERRLLWYNWRHSYWNLPSIPKLVQYTVRGELTRPESWSRPAAPYVPGTLLDFRRGRQNSRPYLGFGWGLRRPRFQEMVDPEARLHLRATFDPRLTYEIVIQARLHHSSATVPATMGVRVNGVSVGELVSSQPDPSLRTYRLRVPGAVLASAPDTTITFSSVNPARGPAPTEPLALQTLVLRPQPDDDAGEDEEGMP